MNFTHKMKTVVIAFDVDGTLRNNTVPESEIMPNYTMVTMLTIFSAFKNVEIVVWSSRGAEYCEHICKLFGIAKYVKEYRLKTWEKNKDADSYFYPDIAIDDQQRFDGGILNLIPRLK